MKVSVIVACRNEAASLDACLDALEGQEHRDLEVVIVDGRSTDGSADIARRRGLRVLVDGGRGAGAARNLGIQHARGEIVAFTDADCVPRFDWLTHLHARFADPAVAGVAGALRLPRTTLLGRLEDNDARLRYRGYITSNVAYRRRVLDEVGGFDAALACAEDYDLAWRIMDAGHRIVHEPQAVVLHAPPEVGGSVTAYLRKQFWYARCDVPAHARAIGRALDGAGTTQGSRAAAAGLASALAKSALATAAFAGLALRSPPLAGGAVALACGTSALRISRAVREIGDGEDELLRMAALETAKGMVRGVGTLAGIAELARAGGIARFRRDARGSPASRPPALRSQAS